MKKGKIKEKKKIKAIECHEYFMLVSLTFLLSGILLFVYCIFSNTPISNLKWFNDPLFFLGIGITSFFMYVAQRYGKFFDKQLKEVSNDY